MITMMIGVAGSGKTTWAKENKPNAIIISTDDIREKLWGDASIQRNPDVVFNRAFTEIKNAVLNGMDVVFDATNLTNETRKVAFKNFPDGVEVEAVFVNTPLSVAQKRNTQRDRVVPEDVILKMSKKLEPPMLTEGFIKIIEVSY